MREGGLVPGRPAVIDDAIARRGIETGMDLDETYLVALEMFEMEKGKEA